LVKSNDVRTWRSNDRRRHQHIQVVVEILGDQSRNLTLVLATVVRRHIRQPQIELGDEVGVHFYVGIRSDDFAVERDELAIEHPDDRVGGLVLHEALELDLLVLDDSLGVVELVSAQVKAGLRRRVIVGVVSGFSADVSVD
jgi:hypothetical protein